MKYVIEDKRGYVTGLSLSGDVPEAFSYDPREAAQYESLSMAQNDSQRLFPGSAVLTYEMALQVYKALTTPVNVQHVTIGQWATYFDTGIWSMKDGEMISPEDLTIDQLKDFLRAGGGAVYLRQDGNFGWIKDRTCPT